LLSEGRKERRIFHTTEKSLTPPWAGGEHPSFLPIQSFYVRVKGNSQPRPSVTDAGKGGVAFFQNDAADLYFRRFCFFCLLRKGERILKYFLKKVLIDFI